MQDIPIRHHDDRDQEPRSPVRGARTPTIAGARSATPDPIRGVGPQYARRPLFHNLPLQLTSFVGREQEASEVARILSTVRLLTLTGVGGVGKTRLALEVAVGLVEHYSEGVWLIELAPLAAPSLVPQAVALALGLQENARQPLSETLVASLKSRELLLLLDNCEHLAHACAELVDVLLRSCPRLRILVTSRAPLGIQGEVTWRVPSLTVPEEPGSPTTGAGAISGLTGYEAVRLFLDRAAAARSSFAATPQNALAIAEICRRLDGIPLAIELAASRVTVLTPEQIAARLDQRFRLLTGGSRTALPRHRTLQATVDWSHDLLSPPERALLRRLSVFAGGWTLEAAEAVCADPPAERGMRDEGGAGPGRRPNPGAVDGAEASVHPDDVLDLLAQLIDKSLVLADERAGAGRYRFLETVRQYAHDRLLEAGEAVAVSRRHLGWFLALAAEAELQLRGPDQGAWFDRLESEHDNLRAALDWSRGDPDCVETGLRLVGAMWRFWILRGHLVEARDHLEQMLALSPAPTAARAKALQAAGLMAYTRGDYVAAGALTDESRELWQTLGNGQGVAITLAQLGRVAQARGDHDAAMQLHRASRDLFREVGGEAGLDSPVARYQAEVAYGQGDYEGAELSYEEALVQSREIGDTHGIANALRGLAHLARIRGDGHRAVGLFTEALALLWGLKDKRCGAQCLVGLARATSTRESPAGPTNRHRDRHAAWLFGAAEALLEAIGTPLTPTERDGYEQDRVAVQARLGEEMFAAAWADGRSMPLDRVFTEVLARSDRMRQELTARQGPHGGSRTHPLTQRERQVAGLIARGLTNREIAAELVVAVRTAETHVEHILAKLGLTSRTQVAAWAWDHGLTEADHTTRP